MRHPLDHMQIRSFQFGRYDPISNTFGKVRVNKTRPHQGWDLLAHPGTPVYAVADGELNAGYSRSYGNWVSLKFSYGGTTYYAFYAHLSAILMRSASVREGTRIAFTGMSGNAKSIPPSEAHLHFELRTIEFPLGGLLDRRDPGEIFGYGLYSCSP